MFLYRFEILLILIFLFSFSLFSQSITDVRKEKEKSEKEISYLNKLLEEAKNNKSASIGKINILRQKIVQSKKVLSSLNEEVAYFQSCISTNKKRIGELQNEKEIMLNLYAKLVYGTWKKRNKTNKLMFICSSTDFNQAYNRFKYFQQIQEYSKRQLKLIQQINDSLDIKNQELKELISKKNVILNEINVKNKELESEQINENQYINRLQREEKDIRKKLQKEMENRKKLTKKLNDLIARQNKKSSNSSSTYKLTPEEKLISADFSKNRGKLPWPVVEGFVSEKFGVNLHPFLKGIMTSNDGVNITTSKNAEVRSVFQGVISEIWFIPGYGNVIVIRHGDYLTLYPGLVEVYVKKGQAVKTKDLIGKLDFDSEKGSVLNFQVWQNTQKLNPELWLAK